MPRPKQEWHSVEARNPVEWLIGQVLKELSDVIVHSPADLSIHLEHGRDYDRPSLRVKISSARTRCYTVPWERTPTGHRLGDPELLEATADHLRELFDDYCGPEPEGARMGLAEQPSLGSPLPHKPFEGQQNE